MLKGRNEYGWCDCVHVLGRLSGVLGGGKGALLG